MDRKEVIEKIKKLIKKIDIPPPQVMIEAKIVETTRKFAQSLGIQWGGKYVGYNKAGFPNIYEIGGTLGGTRFTGEATHYAVNLPSPFGSYFGIGIALMNRLTLDIQLSAMEEKGQGKVLSSPRIITLDNKEAVIKSGTEIPYKTVSEEGTKTEFKEAVLQLIVTPHITADGYIKLKIAAEKSRPDFARAVEGTPAIEKKKAETEIIVRDGETAVIGGLSLYERSETSASVPLLSRIPILGWLFKNKGVRKEFEELLIFITPTIIKE